MSQTVQKISYFSISGEYSVLCNNKTDGKMFLFQCHTIAEKEGLSIQNL